MLRVSNVLNRYFNEGKILKYLSLPGLEYVIEYRKNGEIKIASVKFTNMDNINPDHYGNSGIDVIDFCQANNLDFMQGNVIKYVFRYKNKNGLEDLEKAKEYIDRMIENLLDGEETDNE